MSSPANPDPSAPRNDPGAGDGSGKRPYVKPSFRREEVFETMALACGKISPTQQQCASVPKAS